MIKPHESLILHYEYFSVSLQTLEVLIDALGKCMEEFQKVFLYQAELKQKIPKEASVPETRNSITH